MMKVSRLVLVCAGLIWLLASPAKAQQTLGSINGSVTDASGATMQAVNVTARNTGTNLKIVRTSNNDGSFSFVDFPLAFTKSPFPRMDSRPRYFPGS
jgi:hypothetical protein